MNPGKQRVIRFKHPYQPPPPATKAPDRPRVKYRIQPLPAGVPSPRGLIRVRIGPDVTITTKYSRFGDILDMFSFHVGGQTVQLSADLRASILALPLKKQVAMVEHYYELHRVVSEPAEVQKIYEELRSLKHNIDPSTWLLSRIAALGAAKAQQETPVAPASSANSQQPDDRRTLPPILRTPDHAACASAFSDAKAATRTSACELPDDWPQPDWEQPDDLELSPSYAEQPPSRSSDAGFHPAWNALADIGDGIRFDYPEEFLSQPAGTCQQGELPAPTPPVTTLRPRSP